MRQPGGGARTAEVAPRGRASSPLLGHFTWHGPLDVPSGPQHFAFASVIAFWMMAPCSFNTVWIGSFFTTIRTNVFVIAVLNSPPFAPSPTGSGTTFASFEVACLATASASSLRPLL